jgi:hypothetical protein
MFGAEIFWPRFFPMWLNNIMNSSMSILLDCRRQVCSNQSIDAGGYFELQMAIVVSTVA